MARRGPGWGYRVGKNEIVVKRRGFPGGLFPGGGGGWPGEGPQGSPGQRQRRREGFGACGTLAGARIGRGLP